MNYIILVLKGALEFGKCVIHQTLLLVLLDSVLTEVTHYVDFSFLVLC